MVKNRWSSTSLFASCNDLYTSEGRSGPGASSVFILAMALLRSVMVSWVMSMCVSVRVGVVSPLYSAGGVAQRLLLRYFAKVSACLSELPRWPSLS